MAIFQLVIIVQSPIAVAVLLVCALPLLIFGVHLARLYARIWIPFPAQMLEMAPVVPVPRPVDLSGV